MIIDLFNENNAIDETGEEVYAVRMLPIVEGESPPTIEDLQQAPIMGYANIKRDLRSLPRESRGEVSEASRMTVELTDWEWSLREWLREYFPGEKIWFDPPKGSPTVPMITISGQIGGKPDDYLPIDNPRVSFSVWGPGGDGRKAAVDLKNDLVEHSAPSEGHSMTRPTALARDFSLFSGLRTGRTPTT